MGNLGQIEVSLLVSGRMVPLSAGNGSTTGVDRTAASLLTANRLVQACSSSPTATLRKASTCRLPTQKTRNNRRLLFGKGRLSSRPKQISNLSGHLHRGRIG